MKEQNALQRSLRFSIITVAYNAEKVIEQTIRSVVNQTYEGIQYIIIDGNSSDHTLSIIKNYRDLIDVVISEEDYGIYDAMNKGLNMATGDFIIFMNAGDTFVDNRVIWEIGKKISCLSYVYYGNTIRFYNCEETKKNEKTGIFRITRKNVCHQSIFYPSCIIKHKKYNLRYRILADWALNIELMGVTQFIHIDVFVSKFNLDGISSTKDPFKDLAFINDLGNIIRTNLGWLPYTYFILRRMMRKIIWRS